MLVAELLEVTGDDFPDLYPGGSSEVKPEAGGDGAASGWGKPLRWSVRPIQRVSASFLQLGRGLLRCNGVLLP